MPIYFSCAKCNHERAWGRCTPIQQEVFIVEHLGLGEEGEEEEGNWAPLENQDKDLPPNGLW